MSSIFQPIVNEMRRKGEIITQPKSFQDYLKENELPKKDTWSNISIDSFSRLDPFLRDNGIFVFRLGHAVSGRGTAFSCVDYQSTDKLPILIDKRDFKDHQIAGFIPRVPYSIIHPFTLIPNFTETSVVNLGIASGLIPHALQIDGDIGIPATGQSVYTFEFSPKRGINHKLIHNKGQIEIDSLFTGRRDGKDCLFLIEAKCSNSLDTISKHKIVYPYLSLRPLVPKYIEFVLVYVRVVKDSGSLVYYINECALKAGSVDSLSITNTTALEFPKGIGF